MTISLSQEKRNHNNIVHQEIGNILENACSLHAHKEWDDDKRLALQSSIMRTLENYIKDNTRPVIHDEDGWTYSLDGFTVLYITDEKRISVEADWNPLRRWDIE